MPACLGMDYFYNFEKLYHKLCGGCNGKISVLEEQFCRCGPEAFFRIIKGIKGRKHHEKVNPFYRGSAGGQKIRLKSKHPFKDCDIFCEMKEGGENAYPARQIIFADQNGNYHSILITERIQEAKNLKKELEKQGIGESKPIEAWASHGEEEWINRLCEGFNVRFNWSETTQYEVTEKQEFIATFMVNDKYFRAIAKICFHYFLKYFRQFTGFEKEFNGIKNFIINGGNTDRWVRQIKGSFVSGLKSGVITTDKYCHLLGVNKEENKIIAMLQLFVGPKGVPPHYYEVSIGRNPERIIYPQSIGHQFVYFDEVDQDGFWGRIDPLHTISRNLLP
jgi:hypothetical protein